MRRVLEWLFAVCVTALTVGALWIYYDHAESYPEPWPVIHSVVAVLVIWFGNKYPRAWRDTWREVIWYLTVLALIGGGMAYPLLRFSLGLI